MTFEELHILMDTLLERASSPWVDPQQKDIFLNIALNDWPNWLYESGFEKSQKRRTELGVLVKKHTFSGGSVLKKNEIPKLRFTVGMRGYFAYYDYDANNNLIEVKDWAPISPVSHDERAEAARDPFRKPTDLFPLYIEYNSDPIEVYEILSDNTPIKVEVSYLEDPGVIDGLNKPKERLGLPRMVCEKIAQLAVTKVLEVQGSPRYPTAANELQRSA